MRIKVRIQDGRISHGKDRIAREIKDAERGDYEFSLRPWKETRSNLQNAFIHVCFDVYGKEMGYSPLESKFLLKKEFGLNRLIRNKRTGKQDLWIRDTSEYNREEMKVFIDRLLTHFEFDCSIIIDPEIRKQYRIDEETGELTEI